MGSPVPAINQPSRRFETPDEPVAVEVYVDQGVEPGWYFGTLREWTHYDVVGWTGWVQYSTGPSENRLGRFLAEHIRRLAGDPPSHTTVLK